MKFLVLGMIFFCGSCLVLVGLLLCNCLQVERDCRLWRFVRMLTIVCCVIGALLTLVSFFVTGKLPVIICFAAMFLAIPFLMSLLDRG